MESPLTLQGKVALITGSTRGIGWACARLMARQGAVVLLNGVSSRELLDGRVAELKAETGAEVDGLAFDVASPTAVRDAYAAIFKKYKPAKFPRRP